MARTGVIDKEVYGALLAEHLPKVIETAAEHERMAAALEELRFAGRKLSAEEGALAELLARLVTEYENRVAPAPAGDPVDTLRFRSSGSERICFCSGTPSCAWCRQETYVLHCG